MDRPSTPRLAPPAPVSPGDAFFLPPLFPGSADLTAGGGFGVVIAVNRTCGRCLVRMENGSEGAIPTGTVFNLLLIGSAA